MAPELVKEEQYTRAVDWWALGVIVYEMLLGTRPFTGKDIDYMYEWIEEDEPHYPDSLEPQALSFISQVSSTELSVYYNQLFSSATTLEFNS
ncbi:hypothetical protein XENTR_v10020639 [Xenopus tropicalis]|nr:hypothetical protein XENTR_v10020639 [Xenopus tropicalis]